MTALLTDSEALDAEFVTWFVPVDYDQLWTVIAGPDPDPKSPGEPFFDAYKQWRDTGLWDGTGPDAFDAGSPGQHWNPGTPCSADRPQRIEPSPGRPVVLRFS